MSGRLIVRSRVRAVTASAVLIVATVVWMASPAGAQECVERIPTADGEIVNPVTRDLIVYPVEGQFPGEEIVITGSGWDPEGFALFWFDDQAALEAGYSYPFGDQWADLYGDFTSTETVPIEMPLGTHTIRVDQGYVQCRIEFDVLVNWAGVVTVTTVAGAEVTVATSPGVQVEPAVCVPPMSVSPASGSPGTRITITGTGFLPQTRLDVHFDDLFLGAVGQVDSSGAWSLSSEVPDRSPGSYPLRYVAKPPGGGPPYFCSQPEFTVLAAAPDPTTTTTTIPPPTPTTSPPPVTTAPPPPTSTVETTIEPSDPPTQISLPPTTGPPSDGGGMPAWLLGSLIGLAVGVVGVGGWLLGHRRKAGDEPQPPSLPPPPLPPPPS